MLPSLQSVRDEATKENLRYLDERTLLPEIGDLRLVSVNADRPGWRRCPPPGSPTPIKRAQYPEYTQVMAALYPGDGTTTVDLPPCGGTEPLPEQTWIVRVK